MFRNEIYSGLVLYWIIFLVTAVQLYTSEDQHWPCSLGRTEATKKATREERE